MSLSSPGNIFETSAAAASFDIFVWSALLTWSHANQPVFRAVPIFVTPGGEGGGGGSFSTLRQALISTAVVLALFDTAEVRKRAGNRGVLSRHLTARKQRRTDCSCTFRLARNSYPTSSSHVCAEIPGGGGGGCGALRCGGCGCG
jgi:hypothetical protein